MAGNEWRDCTRCGHVTVRIDTSVTHTPWVQGLLARRRDNFAADRHAGEWRRGRLPAWSHRSGLTAFLARTVRYLTADEGSGSS
jgi:hypothetical protein